MSVVPVAVAGPDWASIMTAIGTVAVAVVAVGVAPYAERRSDRRVADERKNAAKVLSDERDRHDKEIADERALAGKRLAEQLAHSASQLAIERTDADTRLRQELAHADARLAEERQAARDAEQLAEAWAVQVAGGRISAPGAPTGADIRDEMKRQHPVVIVVNGGRYTITRVDARFSDGSGIIGQVTPQPFADYSSLPLPLTRDIVGGLGDVYLGVLVPGAAKRFIGTEMPGSVLSTVYPIVRWTDRWGTPWQRKQGDVRQVADGEQWTA